MKINWNFVGALLLVLLIAAVLFFTPAKKSHAAGLPPVLPVVTATDAEAFRADSPAPLYTGFLELRVPTWTEGEGRISGWQSVKEQAEFGGEIKFPHLIGRFTPFVSGNYSFSQKAFPYTDLKAGAEFEINRDLTFFSYWQRWYTADVDRVYCGFRLNLRG